MKFPTDITPAIGTLPIFYMCHPVAPRAGETILTCTVCHENASVLGDVIACCARCQLPDLQEPFVPVSVVEWNVASARRWWRWLATWEAIAVVAPWMVNVEEWTIAGKTDETPGSVLVERGLRDDCAVVARLDGAIICNRAGRGSTMEANAALAAGRVVYDLRYLGAFPPDGAPGSTGRVHPKDAKWPRWG